MIRRARALDLLAVALVFGAAASSPAAQTDAPQTFIVSDLAAGDRLAVRSAPRADAAVLGALSPGAGPVEVLSTRLTGRTRWAEIIWAEGQGWAAARFLAPLDAPKIGATRLPIGLSCFGNEPFWSFTLETETRAQWRDPATFEAQILSITGAVGAAGRLGAPAVVDAEGDGLSAQLTVDAARCSDGMSDRSYGWRGLARIEGGDSATRLFEGCCTLPGPPPDG